MEHMGEEETKGLSQEERQAFWEDAASDDPDHVEISPALLASYKKYEESMALANELEIEIEEDDEIFKIDNSTGTIYQEKEMTVEGGNVSIATIKEDPIIDMLSAKLWSWAISEMVKEYRNVTDKMEEKLSVSGFVEDVVSEDIGKIVSAKRAKIIAGFSGPDACEDWVREEAMERIQKKIVSILL